MSKTVSFYTLGCRLNMSETGSIAQQFVDKGYSVVDFGEEADVVFLNTCTVTDGADSTCRNLIRKATASSPEGKVVVSGCYAQMEAEKIKRMEGVDLILGTNEKFKVFDYLEEEDSAVVHIEKSNEFWGAATTKADTHTRAFLKIQDGCNYVCSFCIIPFARGRSRIIELDQAVKEAQKLVAGGFKEIVLTGVNIGEYQSTFGEKLSDIIQGISKLQGLERIRLSSVEPNTLTDELLEVLSQNSKFAPHFHVPLQSGDDNILKMMKRKYDTSFYRDRMEKILQLFPHASVGADIIAGFPGETDEEFENTFNFLSTMPITHFHVFPYSKRKNTLAAKMPNQISHALKKERVKKLIELGEKKYAAFAQKLVGTEADILLEEQDEAGNWKGYSAQFLKCLCTFKTEQKLEKNQMVKVHYLSFDEKSKMLKGQIL